MIWSETSTAYTWPSCSTRFRRRIANQLADHAGLLAEQRWKSRRQVLEIDGGRKNRVEDGVAQQRERRSQSAPVRPPRPVGGRDFSDLTRNETQPPAMEGFAERSRYVAAAIPAQLDYESFFAGDPQCGRKSCRRCTGMKDEIAIARRAHRCCKMSADQVRDGRARSGDVDHRHLVPGSCAHR